MNLTIYISGPITDVTTGQPREGWQKEFLAAEAKLRSLGFSVLNPVDIAREVEQAAKWEFNYPPIPSSAQCPVVRRQDYILACLQRMKMSHECDMLHGVYVIGGQEAARNSHGVMMELYMAEVLDIPIYAEYAYNQRVDHTLYLADQQGTIEDFAKELS